MPTAITQEPGVLVLDQQEGRKFLDQRVRRTLGMGLDEFLAAHAAGELDLSKPQVEHLVLLLPFAR